MKQRVCGHCKTPLQRGAAVCAGCQGSVIYGATRREIETAFVSGGAIGALVAAFVWIGTRGLSSHAMVAATVGAMTMGVAFVLREKRLHARHVRTFRHARWSGTNALRLFPSDSIRLK
ncbi:MAG TPA: hypothetical protein VL997_00180 [Dyella sp.]|nr:hypothetical protein [Dyella sp.]